VVGAQIGVPLPGPAVGMLRKADVFFVAAPPVRDHLVLVGIVDGHQAPAGVAPLAGVERFVEIVVTGLVVVAAVAPSGLVVLARATVHAHRSHGVDAGLVPVLVVAVGLAAIRILLTDSRHAAVAVLVEPFPQRARVVTARADV